jgi:hypothetical protein
MLVILILDAALVEAELHCLHLFYQNVYRRRANILHVMVAGGSTWNSRLYHCGITTRKWP